MQVILGDMNQMNLFEKSTRHKGRFTRLPDQSWNSFWNIVKWKWSSRPAPWPVWRDSQDLRRKNPISSTHQARATWINHSTVLIEFKNLKILTDPVFSDRVGPLPWLGVKRTTSPSQTIESLPPIDVILMSHNHYDHLDATSLRKILSFSRPQVITPLGNGPLLRLLGYEKVIELDWWDKHILNSSCTIHLTPALHWSRRGLRDTCRSLWGGFVIEHSPMKLFFAGDTGYHAHFQKIYDRLGPMDLSFLPIGAYEPRWLMKNFHMNPADAVQAHLDLHSKFSMGIHFGTFRLTDEGIDDPIHDLKTALTEAQIDPQQFIAPSIGQTIVV